jgi:hypothetical protein
MSQARFLVLLILAFFLSSMVFAQNEIQLGDTVTGEASPSAVQYALFLEEGQAVGISLSAESFDTYLRIFAEDGSLLAENDDTSAAENPGETDSYLIYSAETSGTIVISVSAFSQAGPTGAYSLSIVELELLNQLDAGVLAFGSQSTVAANGALELSFSFEGAEGQAVSIFAHSLTNEDTRMALLNPEGATIASDDDDGFSTDSAIRRFPLPAAGTYRVVITGFGGRRLFSQLELRVEETEVLLLNSGAQTVSLSPESTSDVVVLDVEAGTSYIITVNASENLDSTLWIYTNEAVAGFAGTQMRVSGTTFFSFAFTPQNTGRASIELELATFDEALELTIAAQAR